MREKHGTDPYTGMSSAYYIHIYAFYMYFLFMYMSFGFIFMSVYVVTTSHLSYCSGARYVQ